MGKKPPKKDKVDELKEEKVNNIDNIEGEESKSKLDENKVEDTNENTTKINDNESEDLQDELSESEKNLRELEKKLEDEKNKSDEYLHLLQLKAAEFENYRKRTIKEKDELYKRSFSEAIELFLPMIDNMERAIAAMAKEDSSKESVREGVEMIYKHLNDLLKNAGVEEIKSVGETFNPELHNAVMHIDDENYGENIIVEEFQKGFMYKGKVIRHSAVKVAN